MQINILHFLKTTKFQILAMIITALLVGFFFVKQYKKTIIAEKIPLFLQVDEKIKQISNPVTVGLHINSFREFNFHKNSFFMDAIIWFRFAKATESLETLEKFTFKNSKMLENGDLIYKSDPIIKILDKDVLVCYNVQVDFMADLNFKNFPLEDHKLNIVLQNQSVTEREMFFVAAPENVTFANNIMVKHWKHTKVTTSVGYTQSIINSDQKILSTTYPCVAFAIDFEGQGAQLPISLYFPLFILFFIVLISLVLRINDSNRLNLVAAGVPALILFRLVIDGISPAIGYVTNIDKTYYTISFLSLFILFFQTYVVLISQYNIDEKPAEITAKLNKKLEIVNTCVFVLVLILLGIFLFLGTLV